MILNYPFNIASAKGVVQDTTTDSKFGMNENVGTSQETVWDTGGLYQYPSSAVIMELSSTDINDVDTTGTGAWVVCIHGLDADYNEISEDILLNGTTPVNSTLSFLRVFRMFIKTAGTSESAIGTITCNSGGITYASINNGNNQTLMALTTVPAGKTMFITMGLMSGGKGKEVEGSFYVRTFGGVFRLAQQFLLYENNYMHDFKFPLAIPEKTDIEVRAKSNFAATKVSAVFDYILIDNT